MKIIKWCSCYLLRIECLLGTALVDQHNCDGVDTIIIPLYKPLFNGGFSLLCRVTMGNLIFLWNSNMPRITWHIGCNSLCKCTVIPLPVTSLYNNCRKQVSCPCKFPFAVIIPDSSGLVSFFTYGPSSGFQ